MQIFTGDDKTSIGDLLDGFSGNISVTANVAPRQMHMMCKYAMEGDSEKASELNKK
jgi:4-hydroxy-tetrahydrodipicolinate synthase